MTDDNGTMFRRVFGPCAAVDGQEVQLEAGDLVERLLLFETVILESYRLKELPDLVRTFGQEGTRLLVECGALQVHSDLNMMVIREREGTSTIGRYELTGIRSPDPKSDRQRDLQILRTLPGLAAKDEKRLRNAIGTRLTGYPDLHGLDALQSLVHEVNLGAGTVREALCLVAEKEDGLIVSGSTLHLEVEEADMGHATLRADVRSLPGVAPERAHQLIASAIRASANQYHRLESMRAFRALTGVQEGELPIVDSKYRVLEEHLNPETSAREFRRVVALTDFPDLRTTLRTQSLDVDKLLRVRESSECAAFRAWLTRSSSLDDQEIRDLLTDFRGRVGDLIRTTAGRTVRFALGLGLGFEPSLGIALSALDTFLLEKVLPTSGPRVFLNSLYPSLFEPEGP